MLKPRAVMALALAALAIGIWSQDSSSAQKLYAEGKYEEARQASLAGIAATPSDIDSYVLLSWSLIALGRYADAENYCHKGLALRRDPRLLESSGEALYFLGRNDAALKSLQEYVGTISEGARVGAAYYYMGEVYCKLGRFGHADISFSSALQFSPGNASWWARLGYAREKYGDATHALEAYKKALSIDPRLGDAVSGSERVSAKLR